MSIIQKFVELQTWSLIPEVFWCANIQISMNQYAQQGFSMVGKLQIWFNSI